MSTPDDPTEHREFEARAKQVFDAGASRIDARTRSRLTQARYAAVAHLQSRTGLATRRFWMPAAGLAAAVVLAVLVVVPRMTSHEPAAAATLADDDMPLLLDSDNVEMLEDLEFYAWLDDATLDVETNDAADAPTADRASS